MSSISGPTPPSEPSKISSLLTHPQQPISDDLLLPNAFDYELAKGEFLGNPTLTIPDSGAHEETHVQVASTVDKVIKFAKKHPYLTGLYALGITILLCAFPAIADSLSKHAGITIGHAHLAVGLSVGIVCLYYGISLMNMAKKAALKDVLETQIKEQNKLQEELLQRPSKKSYENLQSAAQKKIQDMKSYYTLQVTRLRGEKKDVERQLQIGLENSSNLSSAKQMILKELSREIAQDPALASASEQLAFGASLILEEHALDFPESLALPKNTTSQQKENQTKMERLFKAIDTFPKEHPTATLIGLGGLGIVALSGVMLHYLATGTSSAPIIGVVSDVTVMQSLIYGLCMIYEGYNRADIERQKKELERIESEMQKSRAFADSVKLKKEKIIEKFELAIRTYQASLHGQYVEEKERNDALIKMCAEGFFMLLQGIETPAEDPADVENTLSVTVDAAAAG